jgi:hypothetical protein
MDNYSYNLPPIPTQVQSLDQRVTQVMKRVYVKMFLALILSAAAAWLVSSTELIYYMFQNSWSYWFLIILEFGLVIGLSAGINKLSSPVATLLFVLFSIVNGLSLSPIFLIYTQASIVKTFVITSAVFGAMSVYGYTTSNDLSRMGSFLIMALWGVIICSLINIFWHSSTMEWIISFVGVAIFIGLTAWDTQKIKEMAAQMPEAGYGRLATIGALSLYLDFINLFLYLLRFFGNNRD